MCGNLLVTHVDDLDAFVDAAVVDINDVTAAKCENRIDAFRSQSFGDKMTAGNDTFVTAFFGQRVGCG